MGPIPYGKQFISEDDIIAVSNTLASGSLTQGPLVSQFEENFSNYIGSKFSIAVSNGTAALHLSALALGLSGGKKIITTPVTFAATANCVEYIGGEVVFCDIDRDTYLIDLKRLRILLNQSPKGTYCGIIPVDFAGRSVDMEELRSIADEYGLWIIEDACHAPGGYFVDSQERVQYCGNCEYADLSIFSFHPVKHIACGEGGMITTNNKDLYNRLLKLRSHGITKVDSEFKYDAQWANGLLSAEGTSTSYPGWYMEMQELGFNYRLTDIQCALGLSQLKRASMGLERRKEIAVKYSVELVNVTGVVKIPGVVEGHAYHLYVIEVINRRALYDFLKINNIFAQVHYIPTHLMPYYRAKGWRLGDLPNSEDYYVGCISLPMYPTLLDSEQDFVISKIKEFYNG